jgi:mRNA interferase MazF
MEKDFDGWNKKKKQLDSYKHTRPSLEEGEVWWASLGLNIGHEENGRGDHFERPIIILKILSPDLIFALPLTKHMKDLPYYVPCSVFTKDRVLVESALIHQVKALSVHRIENKLGYLSEFELRCLKEMVAKSLVDAK